jgi:hydroxymethylbilane synthase
VQRLCGNELFHLRRLMAETIKIGTRGSQLALWQANWVKSTLETTTPSLSVELVPIKTKGDKILDVPLAQVGGKGLFVKEIEAAILEGRVDLAVHSMKDMPSVIPEGLTIGAVPHRETPGDVLISKSGLPFFELPDGARIGTSSLRRSAQLRHLRPDIVILPLRGNLDTRLKKLDSEDMDAVVLAAAGVKRLNFENRITQYLDEAQMLPAVGQGALCIEIRVDDAEISSLIEPMDHLPTRIVVSGERAFLHRLEGGCQVPIAAHGKIDRENIVLTGLVANVEGTVVIQDSVVGPKTESEALGVALADRLLSKGAKEILQEVYAQSPAIR